MFVFPSGIIPYLDYIVYGLLIFLIIIGFFKGFLIQALQFFGGLFSAFLAYNLAPVIAHSTNFINFEFQLNNFESINSFINDEAEKIVIFFVLFIVFQILSFFIIRPLFESIGKLPIIGFINKILGAFFGFGLGLIYILIFSALLSSPLFKDGRAIVENSAIINIEKFIPQAATKIKEFSSNFDIVDKVLNDKESLTEEEQQQLKDWLLENKFTNEMIEQFINSIK